MILDELVVIEPPDDQWITRLRRGHFVFAVKEQRFAKIEWAYEPPEPGRSTGFIGIEFCWRSQEKWGTENCQTWFIKPDGRGLDLKPLLFPVANNCPDEPPVISEPWVRQMERKMAMLTHRLEQLEFEVSMRRSYRH